MTDIQFRALLDLLMCCDPYPVDDHGNGTGEGAILSLVQSESTKRHFSSWVEAYHDFTTGSLRN